MSVEIFYFRDEQGRSAVEERLKSFGPKALARSLAQIDLLESGETLPTKLDQPVQKRQEASGKQGGGGDDQARPSEAEPPVLRVLTARAGQGRVRYYYTLLPKDRVVIVDAAEGKTARKRLLDKIEGKAARVAASDLPADAFKSHRELVAEATLGDADLAALYARARERARFALALIRLREAAKYTPESLAERTGLSRGLILRVERGHLPKLPALRSLADALQAQIIIAPGSGLAAEPVHSDLPTPADAPQADHTAASAPASQEPAKTRAARPKRERKEPVAAPADAAPLPPETPKQQNGHKSGAHADADK